MNKAHPKLLQRIFQATYERGYRYLDRAGDVMVVLEEMLTADTGKLWIPAEMQPKGATINCPELDATVALDAAKMSVGQYPVDTEIDIGRIGSLVLGTITGRFDLRTMVRYGYRSIRVLPTDSIADADNLSVKMLPLASWPIDGIDGMKASECTAVAVWETPAGIGYRFQLNPAFAPDSPVTTDERLRTKPRFLPTGQREALIAQRHRQQQREKGPVAGVMLDFDYYWVRPDKFVMKDFLAGADALESRVLDEVLKRDKR
ncbi:MAG TPA: hypothetical protein VFE47_25650 [Tepidisphaeraceae bacterium]|jgi:hypothetical protein|nr:hypothetical protein [Tepidisphaeraceae bacterium]